MSKLPSFIFNYRGVPLSQQFKIPDTEAGSSGFMPFLKSLIPASAEIWTPLDIFCILHYIIKINIHTATLQQCVKSASKVKVLKKQRKWFFQNLEIGNFFFFFVIGSIV